jgi:hypothetical protein
VVGHACAHLNRRLRKRASFSGSDSYPMAVFTAPGIHRSARDLRSPRRIPGSFCKRRFALVTPSRVFGSGFLYLIRTSSLRTRWTSTLPPSALFLRGWKRRITGLNRHPPRFRNISAAGTNLLVLAGPDRRLTRLLKICHQATSSARVPNVAAANRRRSRPAQLLVRPL